MGPRAVQAQTWRRIGCGRFGLSDQVIFSLSGNLARLDLSRLLSAALMPERKTVRRSRAGNYRQRDHDTVKGAHGYQLVSVWASSNASKSENRSALLSRYCRSPTALTVTPVVAPATVRWWSAFQCAPSSNPTATAIMAAAAVTIAGRRNHASQPAVWVACSSRIRARSRAEKYGEGSGVCHSSSNSIVRRNEAISVAHAGQVARCSCIAGVARSNLLSTTSINSSRKLPHFITAPCFLQPPI